MKYLHKLLLLSVICLLSACNYTHNKAVIPSLKQILLITPPSDKQLSKEEDNDWKSLKRSMDISGYQFTEENINNLDSLKLAKYSVVIIPEASANAMNSRMIKIISNLIRNGQNVFTDGKSKLADILGIMLDSQQITVKTIFDLNFTKDTLYWTKSCLVTPIDTISSDFQTICKDAVSGKTLAIYKTLGNGKVLYFAPLFDPITNQGYSRFPFLIETLEKYFELKPLTRRAIAETYFDPGVRTDNLNIDSLVNVWHTQGIKRIYTASWYYDEGFDYARVIKCCHENGIQVYCWLETPMVTNDFWKRHPEWREKTAFLEDAHVDWRYLVNLANGDCRKQVFRECRNFLMRYDWDGVNFAEMYFEPSSGLEYAKDFTPMNQNVREEFQKMAGFDPVLIFDIKSPHYWKTNPEDWKKFSSYRKDLCLRLKRYCLDFLSDVKSKKHDFEIITTVIDVSLTPGMADNIAEETGNSLSLFKQYDLTLQIEDPGVCWGSTPDRYLKLGNLYRKNIYEKDKLIFDCNVVGSHTQGFGGFPTEQPKGEEVRQITYYMQQNNIRPAFYAEDAVLSSDYQHISTVCAGKAKVEALTLNSRTIQTPYTIEFNSESPYLNVTLDKKEWFAGNNGQIIVPQGIHTLNFSNKKIDINAFRLLSISGELLEASFAENNIYLRYEESTSICFIALNKKPAHIKIDGQSAFPKIFKNNKNYFYIRLPKGRHDVKLYI
jgi:hypothetical protein